MQSEVSQEQELTSDVRVSTPTTTAVQRQNLKWYRQYLRDFQHINTSLSGALLHAAMVHIAAVQQEFSGDESKQGDAHA